MDVRPLNGDEWQLKRDLRLAALKDSPGAFASTYAREAHRCESEWRDWPRGGAFFAAFCPPAALPPTWTRADSQHDGDRRNATSRRGIGSAAGAGPVRGAGSGPGSALGAGAVRGVGSVPGAGDGGERDGPAVAVGIAGAWVAAANPRTTHLISMWVAPAARGQRIAARLAEAVVDWAREHDTDTVELEVAAGNTAAMAAYLRCGFTVTERDPFTPGGMVLERGVKQRSTTFRQ